MLTFQFEKCELDLGDSGPVAFFGQFKANIVSAAFVWNITFFMSMTLFSWTANKRLL